MKIISISLLVILFVVCLGGCKQKEPTQLESMTSFEFFYGGYNGPNHHIYIDSEKEEKKFIYGFSDSGALLDVRHTAVEDLTNDQEIEEIILTEEEWNAFLKGFAEIQIHQWEDNYNSVDVLDGMQWNIEVQRDEDERIHKSGSNDYPSNWNKLLDLIHAHLEVEM